MKFPLNDMYEVGYEELYPKLINLTLGAQSYCDFMAWFYASQGVEYACAGLDYRGILRNWGRVWERYEKFISWVKEHAHERVMSGNLEKVAENGEADE